MTRHSRKHVINTAFCSCTQNCVKRWTCTGEDVMGGGWTHLLFWHERAIQLRHCSQSGCRLSSWMIAASSLTNWTVILGLTFTMLALSTGFSSVWHYSQCASGLTTNSWIHTGLYKWARREKKQQKSAGASTPPVVSCYFEQISNWSVFVYLIVTDFAVAYA